MDIREWRRSDIREIGQCWLAAYQHAGPADMPLRVDASKRLERWLLDRLHDRAALGYIAEVEGRFAGFLVARVGDWESDPPILVPRRMGSVDVVYVDRSYRAQGIGTDLVRHAIEKMRVRGIGRVETTFEVENAAASRMWQKAGFVPWITRAWGPGSGGGPNRE